MNIAIDYDLNPTNYDLNHYVPLRVRSAYSLLEGAIKVPQLVKIAGAEGFKSIALTDNHNLFGSLEFSNACIKAGIQPIIGCLFNVIPNEPASPQDKDQLLLIAKNEVGYGNLMKAVSLAYMNPETADAPLISLKTLSGFAEGLICLSGGIYGSIGKAILRGKNDVAYEYAKELASIFAGSFYLEIMRHGLVQEAESEPYFLQMALELNIPIVATNDAYFYGKEMYEAHDALICISEGRYVNEDNRRRLTHEHRLKSAVEFCAAFADLPEAIENTHIIASRCGVCAPNRKPILPSYIIEESGVVLSEADSLRKAAKDGLDKRLEFIFENKINDTPHPNPPPQGRREQTAFEAFAKPYYERLEYELNTIINMGFPGYFLIVSDFITWSKHQGIPVGPGRGSGAASVVAWSLLITDLDPLQYDLVFERFLNPERVSMPDFDIDFCQSRRDEVISYVQQRYGRDRVAQIITFGKLQARAVLRDVGRVLQMPYGQVDRICKLVPNNPASPVTLAQAIELEPLLKAEAEKEEAAAKLVDIALKLEGLYRHASTHAAGVVIADRPLDELVPLYRDAKSEMPVVQYSMKYAEEAGLVKFDFLGLKTLTVLKRAVDMVNEGVKIIKTPPLTPPARGVELSSPPLAGEPNCLSDLVGGDNNKLDLLKIPLNDSKTYELLCAGSGVGVFQFESVGMRETLKKLRPDRLEDLIALGALYRPGPMDNIPTYIACKHGREQPNYLHPSLTEVLRETYGVIIYQEQVQKIAQILAGYTLGGADLLRRAMGKKIKEEMDSQRKIFVDGSEKNNVPAKQANEIFDLVAKFAGYGFNKAHAAAYGLIGYQTAYLKANHPYEFVAASMTYDMHNTDKLNIFKQDAENMGLRLLPPDINTSCADFSVQHDASGKHIRYALAALKNVGGLAMEELVRERVKGGLYKNIYDVMERLDTKIINKRSIESLIMAGAFDSLHQNRASLFASIDMLLAYAQNYAEEKASSQISLFGEATGGAIPPPALVNAQDYGALERLAAEYQAVGFYLSSHPLDGYSYALQQMKVRSSNELSELLTDQYRKITMAGVIMGRKFKNSNRGRFAFMQLSDAFGVYETSIYDEGLLNNRELLEIGNLVLLQLDAKLNDDGGMRLIVQSVSLLEDSLKIAENSVPIPRNISFVLQNQAAISQIKDELESLNAGATKIALRIPIDAERYAVINLPKYYSLSNQTIASLAQINGVKLWQNA
jgi:DNA polymerase III subunit alpha